MTAPQSGYGSMDRLLHRLAFRDSEHGLALQRALAGIEDSLLGRENDAGPPARPVFIAALSRAGTTLLLNLLAEEPDFATHTYREMPFPLCPVLWSRLSRRFRRPASERERAHGDGVMVDYDSPEAFEEVLWMAFWRDRYSDDGILPWTAEDRNPEFETFFGRHMRKLIAVRAAERDGAAPTRYLSKNYANIARLSLLPALFPDCRILVPVREPWSHANSLLAQHRRFTVLHAQDVFARSYMGWLGHFEFGAELRPIRFGHHSACPERGHASDPDEIDFWLHYWIAAHEAIRAAAGPHLVLFDYAELCSAPDRSLEALAASIGIRNPRALCNRGERVRRPTRYDAPDGRGNPLLRRRAARLYDALRPMCLNTPRSSATGTIS